MGHTIDALDSFSSVEFTAAKLALAAKMKKFLETTAEISLGDVGTLYPNQLTALHKLYQFLIQPDTNDIGYLVQPTGSGKTLVMALVVKLFDVDTLMLVPRVNLLEYTKNELVSLGIDPSDIGIVGGGYNEIGRKITLSTYQSHVSRMNDPMYRTHNLKKKFIVCDEVHTALGDKTRASISRILTDDGDVESEDMTDEESYAQESGLTQVTTDYQGQALIVGFTATPRLASKHVKAYFKREVAREGILNMIRAGVLAKLRVAHLAGDIQRGVEIEGRKITQEQQVKILSRNDAYQKLLGKYEQIFQSMLEDGQIPRAVARCTNINEANKFADLLRGRGFKAELCTSRDEDAKTPEQQRSKLARLEADLLAGTLDVIVTVDKLAMGWNFPAANIAIDATASASPAKIIQFVGRILRRAKNKNYATLICMSWLVRGLKQKKPDTDADGHTKPLPDCDPDASDDDNDEQGSRRGQRYDFFRALQDSGEDLSEALSVLTDELGQGVVCNLEEIQALTELDVQYFSDSKNIRNDLSAYATMAEVTLLDLNTGPKHAMMFAICANGERVRLRTYLSRASKALGIDSEADTLVKLKQQCGIEVGTYVEMNEVYFRCCHCVKADLQKYADMVGVSIAELTTNSRYSTVSIICTNGELVPWQKYLKRAACNLPSEAEALRVLKELIGIEIAKYTPMDATYFKIGTSIKSDLQKYAIAAGVSMVDITNSDRYDAITVTCTNGELVNFRKYMDRATNAFGFKSGAETLRKLKQLSEVEVSMYIEMDEMYFRCSACIKADLQKYATAAGVSIAKLTTSREYTAIEVTCANGELVSLNKYINRARKAFGLKSGAEALCKLKQLSGVEVAMYIEMDEVYFRCSDCIRADLQKYATAAEVSIAELTTGPRHNVLWVTCANGELVKWQTYLKRAAKAFGLESGAEVLLKLKQLSGTEMPIYLPMDRAYFECKAYVLGDLGKYAQVAGVSISGLKTDSRYAALSAICANGDVIKWQSYLKRAEIALGLDKPGKTLEVLKKVAIDD